MVNKSVLMHVPALSHWQVSVFPLQSERPVLLCFPSLLNRVTHTLVTQPAVAIPLAFWRCTLHTHINTSCSPLAPGKLDYHCNSIFIHLHSLSGCFLLRATLFLRSSWQTRPRSATRWHGTSIDSIQSLISQCVYLKSIFEVSSLFGFLAQLEISPCPNLHAAENLNCRYYCTDSTDVVFHHQWGSQKSTNGHSLWFFCWNPLLAERIFKSMI